MTRQEQWEECQKRASAIVSAYRSEAPEGCDPVASWVVVAIGAGAAISAGATAYAGNKSSKAAEKAGNVKYNTTAELLDDPAQVDPYQVLQQLAGANLGNISNAQKQVRSVNATNYRQANQYLNKIQPQFTALQNQIGNNALSFARGDLPGDVQAQIRRSAAQQGIQGGFGWGSQGFQNGAGANLNLRNLGLTSLDLSKYGTQQSMQVNQQAKYLLPNMAGLQDYLLNPAQALNAVGQNVDAQNRFALQNNQLLNGAIGSQNQALYNQAQSQYAGELAQAQAIGQAGQQLGGAVSGLGTGGGFGTGANTNAGWGGDFAYNGTGTATYRGAAIPKATLA